MGDGMRDLMLYLSSSHSFRRRLYVIGFCIVHLPMFFWSLVLEIPRRFLYHVASGVVLVGEVHRHWPDSIDLILGSWTALMNSNSTVRYVH